VSRPRHGFGARRNCFPAGPAASLPRAWARVGEGCMAIWRASAIGLLALAGVAHAAPAQPPPVPPDNRSADEVTVTGNVSEDVLRSFVEEIDTEARHTRQLSRWDRSICPGIAGVQPAYAQLMLDRIAQRAVDVGLRVGAPGCKANVLILVTPD